MVWERAMTTITEPQQLNDELERIRQRGWSFDNGRIIRMKCASLPHRPTVPKRTDRGNFSGRHAPAQINEES